jgi:hypothetical protein
MRWQKLRRYIFTEREVERLLAWLKTGEEDNSTRMLLSRIRKNWPTLRDDIELFILAMKKMRALGRGDPRPRLRKASDSEASGKANALSDIYRKARALKAKLEADRGRDLRGVDDE